MKSILPYTNGYLGQPVALGTVKRSVVILTMHITPLLTEATETDVCSTNLSFIIWAK